MSKERISKSEIDFYIANLIKGGDRKVTDKKQGTKRVIETTQYRVSFSSNGWVEKTPI